MDIVTLAKRSFREFTSDDASTQAQSIAYSVFFSIFPLLLGATAILGFVLTDPDQRAKIFNGIYTNLPASGDFIAKTLEGAAEKRGSMSIIAILLLIASGRGMFLSVMHGINVAFDVKSERGFVRNIILAFELLFGVGLLLVLSLVVTAAIQALASISILGFGPYKDSLILTPIQFLVTLAISWIMFTVLYKLAPNIEITWREAMVGAGVAAFLFEIAKLAFVFYVRVGLDTTTYGPIGGVIVLLTWCYFSSMIVLLGAEVSSEYRAMNAEAAAAKKTTPETTRPGPVMVAPAQPPPLMQRVVAIGSTIAAAVAAYLAVHRTRGPSGQV
jgi:membrane protein